MAAVELRLTPAASAASITALEHLLTGRGAPWGLRFEIDAREPHSPVAGVLRREGLDDAYYYCEYGAPREGLPSSPSRCVLSLGSPPEEVRLRPAGAPGLPPAPSWGLGL